MIRKILDQCHDLWPEVEANRSPADGKGGNPPSTTGSLDRSGRLSR